MTSVLNSLVKLKLPRYVKITNGKDENNAVVLDDKRKRSKEWHQNYYQIHKDEIRTRQRIYEDKNKERIRERRKRYRLANKERLRLKSKMREHQNKQECNTNVTNAINQ